MAEHSICRPIVLSGRALYWCSIACFVELFDDETRDRLDVELLLADGLAPKSPEESAMIRRVFSAALRRPISKRREYLAANCQPRIHYWIYLGMGEAIKSIEEEHLYRVHGGWIASAAEAVLREQWRPKREGASDEAMLRRSVSSLGYIGLIRAGMSADLVRWLAHYFLSCEPPDSFSPEA